MHCLDRHNMENEYHSKGRYMSQGGNGQRRMYCLMCQLLEGLRSKVATVGVSHCAK